MADDTAAPAAAAPAEGAAPAAAENPGSLLDTAAKPVEKAAAPAVADQAAPPAVEGFLGGKYKTAADLENGYKELQRVHTETSAKLKGFKGAPEKYELSMPDDLKEQVQWSADDPLLSGFMDKAKGWGMSQEAFTEAVHMLAQYEFANASGDLKAEKERLGENADQRLTDFQSWLSSNLEDERGDVIRQALRPNARLSDVFTAMETLVGLTRQPVIKPGDDVQGGMTVGDIDKKYRTKGADGKALIDTAEGRARYRAELAQVVGTGEHIQVMGKKSA